jgi:N-glycosylase/DNA lyase
MTMYRIQAPNFNLDLTLSCGQVFRWDKKDQWAGVVNGTVIRAQQEGSELIIESTIDKKSIQDYFRLNDDLEKIYSEIGKDELINSLIRKYHGLRLIRQDPWECLVSYICSSNNTIRNIKNSIRLMCECFGSEIENGYYSFPTPEALSHVDLCDLTACRMGFRTSNVLNIASMIVDGEFDMNGVKDLSYEEGREELVKIKGVGNKIADCVLLFAFGKLDSFPVDTHIEQIMERFYLENFKNAKKSKKRDEIADFARGYFGRYCGYAQEYLYLADLDKI